MLEESGPAGTTRDPLLAKLYAAPARESGPGCRGRPYPGQADYLQSERAGP